MCMSWGSTYATVARPAARWLMAHSAAGHFAHRGQRHAPAELNIFTSILPHPASLCLAMHTSKAMQAAARLTFRSLAAAQPAHRPAGVQAMLYIVAIMRLGSSGLLTQPADDDSLSRMKACLRVLTSHDHDMDAVWLAACRKSFVTLIGDKQRREADELKQLVSMVPPRQHCTTAQAVECRAKAGLLWSQPVFQNPSGWLASPATLTVYQRPCLHCMCGTQRVP